LCPSALQPAAALLVLQCVPDVAVLGFQFCENWKSNSSPRPGKRPFQKAETVEQGCYRWLKLRKSFYSSHPYKKPHHYKLLLLPPSTRPSGDPPRVVGSMSDSPCQAVTISGFFSRSAKFFHTLMAPSSWGAQTKRTQCSITADATLVITCAQRRKIRSGTAVKQSPKLRVSLELNSFYQSCFSSLILHP